MMVQKRCTYPLKNTRLEYVASDDPMVNQLLTELRYTFERSALMSDPSNKQISQEKDVTKNCSYYV